MTQTMTHLPCEYIGDTLLVDIAITDDQDLPVDISGGSIDITFKTSMNDASELYTLNVTVFDDPTNGIHQIVVPDTATAGWVANSSIFYDIKYSDVTGIVDTFQFGTITMLKPVHNV